MRKFIDEQSQYDGTTIKLTVPNIYDRVKRSNSSLNRKNKRLLEGSIERVIAVVKDEDVDDDATSIEGNFEGMEETPRVKVGPTDMQAVLCELTRI